MMFPGFLSWNVSTPCCFDCSERSANMLWKGEFSIFSCSPLPTVLPRYELLRLGMGQEVAARRAFIAANRGGPLSWPFVPRRPLSVLVPSLPDNLGSFIIIVHNCDLGLGNAATYKPALQLFQRKIEWPRLFSRNSGEELIGLQCRQTGCAGCSRQHCQGWNPSQWGTAFAGKRTIGQILLHQVFVIKCSSAAHRLEGRALTKSW